PAVNKDGLKAKVDEAPDVRTGKDYTNATDEAKKAYDEAVAAGQKVRDNPDATQEEVDAAKKAIEDALTGLSENPAGNKDGLKAKEEEAPDVKTGKDYTNATDEAKKAYDDAVAAGQKVIDNPDATPEEVDAAKKAIEKALIGCM
ncbi:FIVAR domain-containing protein, partial [Streptococcus suis]